MPPDPGDDVSLLDSAADSAEPDFGDKTFILPRHLYLALHVSVMPVLRATVKQPLDWCMVYIGFSFLMETSKSAPRQPFTAFWFREVY